MSLILNGTDNSASTPAVTGGTGGTGTGVFYPTTNQVALATNGTTAITVDASQNVGIGTASPTAQLSTLNNINIGNNASSNPFSYLRFGCSQYGAADIRPVDYGSHTNGLAFYTDGTGDATINPTERMRIDSSGKVFNNCTGITNDAPNSAGGRVLEANGNQKIRVQSDGQAAFQFYSPTGGTSSPVGSIGVYASGTTYATSSDYRLKHDIAPMTNALNKVAKLKPVIYKWNINGSNGQGFIAHELQEVVPDCVIGKKDAVDAEGNPVYQGIDTSFLVATLTAAIQELNAKVEALEAKLV